MGRTRSGMTFVDGQARERLRDLLGTTHTRRHCHERQRPAGRFVAVYLIPDLAQDFDAFVKLAERHDLDRRWCVSKDAQGEVEVQETGDHLGRKGVKVGGGVGLVVGLFAPPLLAATAIERPRAASSARSRASACRRVSARRWTRRCHPARRGSSRSTTMTTPMPSPVRSGTDPLVDRTDRQGLSLRN